MNATPTGRPTDSEIVTEYAVDALREGRFDLARALTTLAATVARTENRKPDLYDKLAVPAPYAGPLTQAPSLQVVRDALAAGPTGNGNADLAREEAAATAVARRPVPQSTRCVQMIEKGAQWLPCELPIFLEQAVEAGEPPFWLHVDTSWNTHHDAQAPAGHAF